MEQRLKRIPIWGWLLLVLLLLSAAGMVLALTPTQTIAIGPHAPIDLQGRLRIDGKRPEPAHGHLFLVGVSEKQVSMLQRALLSFNDEITFESLGTPSERRSTGQRDRDAIQQSKKVAGAAAFGLLGQRVKITGAGAFVNQVDSKGPAGRALRSGDRIVKLNGRLVNTSIDVTRAIGSLPPGSRVTLGVRRDNLPFKITLRTGPPLKGDRIHRSRIGVGLTTPRLKITLPKKINVDSGKVIGPSAGLAFALAIYDSESPVDLLRGRYIVATGSLSLEGEVLRVGGVRQKAIATQKEGYDLLIVPKGNVQEAVLAVSESCESGSACVGVLAVDTVAQAVEYLKLGSRELDAKLAN